MDRYILTQTDSTFACIDTKENLRVEFYKGRFNDSQVYRGGVPDDDLPAILNEMTLWLVNRFEERPWELDDRFYKEQIRKAIGTLIRQSREAKGMSQRDLANQAGISSGNVANIEQGKYSPGIDIIDRLARVLEITIPVGKQ